MNRKQAQAKLKQTGKSQKVTEGSSTESIRVGVSLKIEHHVLEAIKANALKLGMPYQTYINSLLNLDAQEPTFDVRRKTELRLNILENAIEKLTSKEKSA